MTLLSSEGFWSKLFDFLQRWQEVGLGWGWGDVSCHFIVFVTGEDKEKLACIFILCYLCSATFLSWCQICEIYLLIIIIVVVFVVLHLFYITWHFFIQSVLHTFSTVGNAHRSRLGWSALPKDTYWLQQGLHHPLSHMLPILSSGDRHFTCICTSSWKLFKKTLWC